MTFKSRINRVRRTLMNRLTRGIGSGYSETKIGDIQVTDIKKVLIVRPNQRLGNQLLLTPLVQEVINTFPNCKIDLFVKGGIARPIFENYSQVHKIIQLPKRPFSNLFEYVKQWALIKRTEYDLVVNGDKNSSSGRLLTELSRSKFKIFCDDYEGMALEHADYRHISKYPIYNLRHYLKKMGISNANATMPLMDIKLTDQEIENGKKMLETIIRSQRKTICLFTNATGDKCYSEDWWHAFYGRLREEFPDYNIIELLPIENISKINFKAPHFYSKDIREMGAIINNTSIFIAADNGVMHLASASLTPTVGFFSVTDPKIYGPYGNGSMAINTNETSVDDWLKSIRTILAI